MHSSTANDGMKSPVQETCVVRDADGTWAATSCASQAGEEGISLLASIQKNKAGSWEVCS